MLASCWPSLFHFSSSSSSVFLCSITETHTLKQRTRRTRTIMGLSNIPNLSEGVLPALVVNTVLSVVLLKNMLRSVLEAVGVTSSSSSTSSPYSQNMEEDSDEETERESWRRRRVSITQYKICSGTAPSTTTTTTTSDSGSSVGGLSGTVECCVCLCGFESNQEVSELPCKHFFHRACLDKWFDNKHLTCPLCRSID